MTKALDPIFHETQRYFWPATEVLKRTSAILSSLVLVASCGWTQTRHPEWRGLIASPSLQGQPVKGVYFFAGEGDNSRPVYTAHPTLADDLHWNSMLDSRARVMNRIAAAHVNTVVMSYWSDMPQWSPMTLLVQNGLTAPGVIEAVRNTPMLVIPAMESGFDANHPELSHLNFQSDFPHPQGSSALAPGLVLRIGWLVQMFRNDMNRWAQVYDTTGEPRYAINILHACSDQSGLSDAAFASAFGAVAAQVQTQYHINVGFTLDTIGGGCRYIAFPGRAAAAMKAEPAVLAIMGFESEVFSGKLVPHDNNRSNLPNLAAWKRAALNDWIATEVPIILDVSNGYDGHLVFPDSPGSFWGDNLSGTDDRWRNWMSELKSPGVKGIVMDTWNGYTEGYAAVPTREHGDTVYNWLTDLLEPDPRACSHMHYVNGVRTFRVQGAICDKWVQLGADLGFGRPASNELPTTHGRRSEFADGKAIYWSAATNAHELHGLIYQAYVSHGSDGGCLGLPVSDEEPDGHGGRMNRFQRGTITWKQGDQQAGIHCP